MATYVQTGYRSVPDGLIARMVLAGSTNPNLTSATWSSPLFGDVTRGPSIVGMVPSGNKEAIRFNERLGFKLENELHDAHPDGSLLLMTMRREECRWLDLARLGRDVKVGA